MSLILLTKKVPEEFNREIKLISNSRLDIREALTLEEQLMEINDTEIIFGNFDLRLLPYAENLKWIQYQGAGSDHLLTSEFIQKNIILTSAKGLVGKHLAEHAWSLLLGIVRQIYVPLQNKKSFWNEEYWKNREIIREKTIELEGKKMMILGFGGMGYEVAKKSQGYGMKIIGIDTEEKEKPSFVNELRHFSFFYESLNESDIVVIASPLTKETYHLFNEKTFDSMKNNSILINVARGKIIEYCPLIKILESKKLYGVGLDVTPIEPLPLSDCLWNYENVLITPHIAGGSPLRDERVNQRFLNNLRKYFDNVELEGLIDKIKGY